MYWVDPPSGWLYDFPKKWDGVGDLDEWIISQGYSKKLMKQHGKYFYVRMWEATDEDCTETNNT